MIIFEYVQLQGDFYYQNTEERYQILEFRLKVYSGKWKFDNGLILDKDFNYYSQSLNAGEVLLYQNINIQMLERGFAILIIKKQLNIEAKPTR